MNEASVFLRQFLLFVFYANISSTSPVHLEGVKEARTMTPAVFVVNERWPGPPGSRTQQLHAEPISERKRSAPALNGWLATIASTSRLVTSRRMSARVNEDYQGDDGKEDEEEEEEDKGRHSQTDRGPHQPSSNCLKRLEVDIEHCLSGYERTLRHINPKDQLNDSSKLELCHEYGKTMQCLHMSFSFCRPGHHHLQLIAYRLGYLRTVMEQTCEEPEEPEETVEDGGNDARDSESPQLTTTAVAVDPAQLDLREMDDGGTDDNSVISLVVNKTLKSVLTTHIWVPGDLSETRTVTKSPSSTSMLSPTSHTVSSSSSSSFSSASSSATSSPETNSATTGATVSLSHLRMTTEQLTSEANPECADALSCGGREFDVDNQQRTSMPTRTWSSQHPTASEGILAAILPVVNSSRGFNGRLTRDPETTVATQRSFPSSSSGSQTAQTGALVSSASSSVGGTKAAQCRSGVTCSNPAGNGSRSCSLDYHRLALSAVFLLVLRVNGYFGD